MSSLTAKVIINYIYDFTHGINDDCTPKNLMNIVLEFRKYASVYEEIKYGLVPSEEYNFGRALVTAIKNKQYHLQEYFSSKYHFWGYSQDYTNVMRVAVEWNAVKCISNFMKARIRVDWVYIFRRAISLPKHDCIREILINIIRPSSDIYKNLLELIEEYKQSDSPTDINKKIFENIWNNLKIIESDIADILNPKYNNRNTCRWFQD